MNQFLSFKSYIHRGKKWSPSRKIVVKLNLILALHLTDLCVRGSSHLSASNSMVILQWLCILSLRDKTNYFLSWQSTSKASLRHFLNVPSSNINVSNSIMKLHLSEVGLEIQWPITGKRWWAFLEALLWDLGSSPLRRLWIASRGTPEEEEGWTILLLAPQAQPLSFSSNILVLIVKKIWQACPRESFRHPAQPMNLLFLI